MPVKKTLFVLLSDRSIYRYKVVDKSLQTIHLYLFFYIYNIGIYNYTRKVVFSTNYVLGAKHLPGDRSHYV